MKHATIIVLYALVLTAPLVHADENSDAQARVATIHSWLDAQTIALMRVDLSHMDPEESWEIFRKLLEREEALQQHEREQMDRFKSRVGEWMETFTEAGGRDIYAVISLADWPKSMPYLIAPVAAGGDGQAVSRQLLALPLDLEAGIVKDGTVFAGPQHTFDRLQKSPASGRSGLNAAFETAGDTAIQLLVVPSDDHRRVLRELLPVVVPELGDDAGPVIADGFLWIAVGADLPPRTSVNVVINSKSPEAAVAMQEFLAGTVLPNVFRIPAVSKVLPLVPESDRLAELLTPQVENNRLVLHLDETSRGIDPLVNTLGLVAGEVRTAIFRDRRRNALHKFGIALHNYDDVHGHFPPAYSTDEDGKPLLSWRVLILPYVGYGRLYREFHLDEPWDSEHNRKLTRRMPKIYGQRRLFLENEGKTTFLAPVGEGLAFEGKEPVPIKEFTDGTSNTLLVVDAAKDSAVIWTKPEDLQVDLKNPLKGLVDEGADGFLTLFTDGSARFIEKTIDPAKLRALFTRAGGEPVSW